MKVRLLEKRGGSTQYRKVIPKELRAAIGRSKWVKSWPAGTPESRIVREKEQLAARHDSLIARARAGEVLDPAAIARGEREAQALVAAKAATRLRLLVSDWTEAGVEFENDPQALVMINSLENGGKYTPPRKLTLADAYEIDKHRFGGKRDEQPIKTTIDSFAPFVEGLDLLTEIRTEHAMKWVDAQRAAGFAAGTIRRNANAIQGVITRTFRTHEVARVNPFSKLGIGGKHKETDRLPFTRRHLELIDAHLPKCPREVRNLLTLIKYTGASASELAGSLIANVHLDAAIPNISIRPNALRDHLKTESRKRSIPLIGPALEAARDQVELAKGNKDGKLFKGYSEKHGANSLSARLSVALRAAGVPKSKRLTVYSFRHTLVEAMRQAGVSSDLRRMIFGHSAKDSHDRYGAPAALLSDMRDALQKAVPKLGDVDESIYRPDELG